MKDSHIPLIKYLTEAGLGSRRKMAEEIKSGKIQVNGAVAEGFTVPVNPATDVVVYAGKKIRVWHDKYVYLMLHKPPGVLSTTSDKRGRETIMDLLPSKYQSLRLYPVGRLDIDTTGLLILTNDGALTHKITHPSYEKEKEYWIRIESELTAEDRKAFSRGIKLDDGVTAPAILKENKNGSYYNYSLIIHEGKKRQIRRMFAHLGYSVKALKRVRVGRVRLGNLKQGEIRLLTPLEIRSLRTR